MWSKPVIIEPPASEPITLAQAKQFLRLDEDETGFDAELGVHIAGARGRVESMTGSRMVLQTVDLAADGFPDLERLPVGPVTEIVAVDYRDRTGIEQTISLDALELFGAGLEQGVRLVAGNRWPAATSAKGAVRVRVIVGYGEAGAGVPDAVRTAMLLQVRALFDDSSIDLEPWIINDRIWL